MADVKWIKLATGLPDNRKIKQIRRLPEGDTIALMWVFLMCLAGETNDDGMVYFTPEIPFTEEMLADQFAIDLNTIRLGLTTFQRFGMIEIVDDIICLSSWEKWQAVDRLSEIREYNRLAKRKSREKKKALQAPSEDVNDKSMTSQRCHDTDKEGDKDKEEDKKEKIDYQLIADMYNRLCPSFPSIRSLSEARKKAIKARLKTYTLDDFQKVFENAEASSFLKGSNNRNWTANFDWLMKDANMAKVLDGNYADKARKKPTATTEDYYSGDQLPW